MDISELQIGDVIFYGSKANILGIELEGTPLHVAMYTGDINGKPYVTHSVINNFSGVQTTILKPLGHECLDVFRCNDPLLAKAAASLMLDWAKYRIPYDIRRANWMVNASKVTRKTARRINRMDEVDYLLEQYIILAENKFYETVKFAARRGKGTCPVNMTIDSETGEHISRGFTCVQAIILAFRVAQISPWVKDFATVKAENASVSETIEQSIEFWISDKHCMDNIFDVYKVPDSYHAYRDALQSREEFEDLSFNDKRPPQPHPHYQPSIVAWRYDLVPEIDAFRKKFKFVLELPAKLSYTDVLYAYMNKFTEHWQYLGPIDKSQLTAEFNSPEKRAHRERRDTELSEILSRQESFARERQLSSPRLSGAISPYNLDDLPDRPLLFRTISSQELDSSRSSPRNPSPLLVKSFKQ